MQQNIKPDMRKTVYDLAIQGFCAKQIMKFTRRTNARISQILSSLIDDGFLKCINPRDKVKIYEATKKPFSMIIVPVGGGVLNYRQQGKTEKKVNRGFNMTSHGIRCHAIGYISDVKKMGKVPWDKKWKTKSAAYCLYRYPFKNVGEISFQWILSRTSNQLKITLPSIWWNYSDGDPEPFLRNVADMAGTWFMKEFHCDLRGLRKCGKGHFEIPVHDKGLVELAQASSIQVGDFVLDCSLGYPEFGSVGGYDSLVHLLLMVPKLDKLLAMAPELEELVLLLPLFKLTIPKLVLLLPKLELLLPKLEEIVTVVPKLAEDVDKLVKLLSQPIKEDEYIDVT